MEQTTAAASRVRILLVEDDDEQRDALSALLEADGHEVDVAIDGGAAVSQAASFKPDVVLMDLGLPMIDGCHAIRQLSQGSGKAPYLIVLTAQTDPGRRQAAFEAGCDEYVTKPCNAETLLDGYAAARGRA